MKCPNCNAETVDGAGFCPSCGHELKNDELIYCPNCGELTKARASFCAKCGFKFQEKYKSSGVETRSVEFICGLIGSLIGISSYHSLFRSFGYALHRHYPSYIVMHCSCKHNFSYKGQKGRWCSAYCCGIDIIGKHKPLRLY